MFTVLHNHLELLLGVLLECVPVEERAARVASSVVKVAPICVDALTSDAT